MSSSPKRRCVRPVGPNGSAETWSTTNVNVYTTDHPWILNNYSFQDAKGEHIKSSPFTSDFDGETDCKWFLYLKPRGEKNCKSKGDNDSKSKFENNIKPKGENDCKPKIENNSKPKSETNSKPKGENNNKPKGENYSKPKSAENDGKSKNENDSKPKDDEYVALYLHLDPSSQCKNIFAKTKFSIVTENQKEAKSWDSSITEFIVSADGPKPKRLSWGCAKFVQRCELLNPENNLLPNDTLTIFCKIEYSQVIFTNTSHSSKSIPSRPALPNNRLSEDFGVLLKSNDFADALISANGVNYPVHRTILMARSPVFSAMFKYDDMQETETKCVNIPDIEENVLKELLRYIYTGKVEKLEDLAGGLLAAADKYDLTELKDMCEIELIENLSIENAANTLVLADLYRADELKSEAMNFVVSKSAKIMNTEAWDCLVAPRLQLVNEVCKALSHRLDRNFK
ncbi:speckle-type POZ protein B-like [Planococcus citri]|uniref:speckle-type POZ protein B-like n=1 Tax=Planococcus citri TaxID=170843 RepID=UPI0031F8EC19